MFFRKLKQIKALKNYNQFLIKENQRLIDKEEKQKKIIQSLHRKINSLKKQIADLRGY